MDAKAIVIIISGVNLLLLIIKRAGVFDSE